ncbi:MAG: hypothetical protein ACMUIP_00160 [bacterium]
MISRSRWPDLRKKRRIDGIFLVTIFLGVMLAAPPIGHAADNENCQLCHRYSGLGCFEQETGQKKVFYVNEAIYRNTVHGSVACTHCHTTIKEVPHKPGKRVDCGAKCHVKEPSTEKDFSHKAIVEDFKSSVHGTSKAFLYADGQAKCKYCHQNPIYQPLRGIFKGHGEDEINVLARCIACHQKSDWAQRFLNHFVSRTEARWNDMQIVELCNNCHGNDLLMKSYGLESTLDFVNNFHWRNVKYGSKNGASCIDCHGPKKIGYSPHKIRKTEDKESALYIANRKDVCGQEGCHEGATRTFAKGNMHTTGVKVSILTEQLKEKEETLSEEEKGNFAAQIKYEKMEKLKKQIIWGIKLFYKFLIFLVPGTMLLHQLLDLTTILRTGKKGGHEH